MNGRAFRAISMRSRSCVCVCSVDILLKPFGLRLRAGGDDHTVLLRSDRRAVVCGYDRGDRCNPPNAAAGGFHTALPRSDGQAAAWGCSACGECDLPALKALASCAPFGTHTVLPRPPRVWERCAHVMSARAPLPAGTAPQQ